MAGWGAVVLVLVCGGVGGGDTVAVVRVVVVRGGGGGRAAWCCGVCVCVICVLVFVQDFVLGSFFVFGVVFFVCLFGLLLPLFGSLFCVVGCRL